MTRRGIITALVLLTGITSALAGVQPVFIVLEGTVNPDPPCTNSVTYTVPAGKTLVVEYLGNTFIDTSKTPDEVTVSGNADLLAKPPGGSLIGKVCGQENGTIDPVSKMSVKLPAGTVLYAVHPMQYSTASSPQIYRISVTGLLVDNSDLYVKASGQIESIDLGESYVQLKVRGPRDQASQVEVESTDRLAGGAWDAELDAEVLSTQKGSTEFDIRVPFEPADESHFFRTRFKPKS